MSSCTPPLEVCVFDPSISVADFFFFSAKYFEIRFDKDAVWMTLESSLKAISIWVSIILENGGKFENGIVEYRLNYDANTLKGPTKTALCGCINHPSVKSQLSVDYLLNLSHAGPEGRDSLLIRPAALAAVQGLSADEVFVATGVVGLTHTAASPPIPLRLKTIGVFDLQALVKTTDIPDVKSFEYWRIKVHLETTLIDEEYSQWKWKKSAIPNRKTSNPQTRRGISASLTTGPQAGSLFSLIISFLTLYL